MQSQTPKNFDDEALVRELIDKSIMEDRIAPVPSLLKLGEVGLLDGLFHFNPLK